MSSMNIPNPGGGPPIVIETVVLIDPDTGQPYRAGDAMFSNDTFQPVEDEVMNLADTKYNGHAIISPASSLSAAHINMPSNENSVIGQTRTLIFTENIAVLTMNQIGGGATMMAGAGEAQEGVDQVWRKIGISTWKRIVTT